MSFFGDVMNDMIQNRLMPQLQNSVHQAAVNVNNAVADGVNNAIDNFFVQMKDGDTTYNSNVRGSSRTDYNSISTSGQRQQQDIQKRFEQTMGRCKYGDKYAYIISSNSADARREASSALASLHSMIDTVGNARVADLYEKCHMNDGGFSSYGYGWTNKNDIRLRQMYGAYVFDCATPQKVSGL